jgi:amino acid adenylation domain-containing protein
LTGLIAEGLGLQPSEIDDDLSFQAVPAWDSLGHAELMVVLEDGLGVEIGEELTLRLTTVAAIREFADDPAAPPPAADEDRSRRTAATDGAPVIHRGLDGIFIDRTSISSVDSHGGRLLYRGYPVTELAAGGSFEETAHLLVHGELPGEDELASFERDLGAGRGLPEATHRLLGTLTGVAPATALRTAVSSLAPTGGFGPASTDELRRAGCALIACCPTLIATHDAHRNGRPAPEPDPSLSHAANLLGMLEGARDDRLAVGIMDTVLVLQAEHGSGAATLAARVAAGTRSGLYPALVAALATFEGDNHGGAVGRVMRVLEEIGDPAAARAWVERCRERGEPVPGFGHRVYRIEDPRARPLREAALALCENAGDLARLEILDAMREAMAPLARHGVNVNVDFYAALVYELLGISPDLSTPLFASARLAGWIAHTIEQHEHNVLIRPRLHYVGHERPWRALESRKAGAGGASEPGVEPRLLLDGFRSSVLEYPERPALAAEGREWTYSELDETARRWAAAAVPALEDDRRRIAFLGYRSETSYVAPLAALFAGSAFVPLNPTFPVARTRRMLERADPAALIVCPRSRAYAEEVLSGAAAAPETIHPEELGSARPLAEPIPADPDDVAYLLFTSGSTGMPKGVPISHRNVVHFLEHVRGRYELGPGDRLSQTFDQTFDLSVFDLFAGWSAGACVCSLRPIDLQAPARAIDRLGITVWFSVPSVPALLRRRGLLRPGSLPRLRWSLFCGEALPVESAEAWQAAAPGAVLENLYGPTELTIACSQYRWDPGTSPAECVDGFVPIGDPYPGLEHTVLGDDGRPGAIEGELAVGGPQAFAGYWRDPEETAAKMIELPAAGGESRRLYRTGDRVRRLPAAGYAYLGRSDQQVKVRGHRVELGEVELALRGAAGVEDAIVVPWASAPGETTGLAGFVTGAGVAPDRLTELLRESLPPYAVPDRIRVIDDMPRNANGKTDRAVLAGMLEPEPGA